jgi:CRP/FNR family transcriptional regulator
MNKNITDKLEGFFNRYKSVSYEAGEIILRPNEEIENIYYIKSGNIRQYIDSPEGDKLIMQIFHPHAYIPLVIYLSKGRNKYTFQAIVPTEVLVAPVEDVVGFIKKDPEILFDLSTRFSQAIEGLLQKIEHAAFDDAYTRVLSLLIYLAERFGEKRGNECVITLSLSHYDIASWLGMHRETISRRLAVLQERGIIKYEDGHIVFVNLEEAKKELAAKKE